MGAGASGFKSEQEALKAGKTQEEIDAWKKANEKPKFYYFGLPGRGLVVFMNRMPLHWVYLLTAINLFIFLRFASYCIKFMARKVGRMCTSKISKSRKKRF